MDVEPNCRYEAVFYCPKNVSHLPVQFAYINSDYTTYASSSVNLQCQPLEVKNLLKGLTGALICLFFAILNGVRAPFIGADLSKLYVFASLRCLEAVSSVIVYPFNHNLGSYMLERSCHHMVLYDTVLERLKDQDISFLS